MDDATFERFLRIEREMGAFSERHRALEANDERIRLEVSAGFDRQERSLVEAIQALSKDMASQNAHLRGEIARLVTDISSQRRLEEDRMKSHAEETRRNHEALVNALRADVAEAQNSAEDVVKQNRRIITLIGIGVLVGQFILEHLSEFVALFGP